MQNYEEIVKEFDYSVKNGYVSLDLVRFLIMDEVNKMDLSNTIKDVKFTTKTSDTIIKNKTIIFGIKLLSKMMDEKELGEKDLINIYRYLLEELYGELNRLQQRKILWYYEKYKDEMRPSELLEMEKYALIVKECKNFPCYVYEKSFDLLPTEHEARYIGFYKALTKIQEISPLFNEITDSEEINREIVNELTKEYVVEEDKSVSPYERIFLFGKKKKAREELSRTASFDNYKRLIMGLPTERYVVNDLRTDMRLRQNEFYDKVRII